MASNPIDCIKLHAPNLSTDKNISRQDATDLALKEFEKLHGELEAFKKSLDKKYTVKPFVSPDKSARIKEIQDDYDKRIADEKIKQETDNANKQSQQQAEEKSKPVEPVDTEGEGAGKEPPIEGGEKVDGEDGAAGITHAETEQNRKEFGLPEYEKQKQTIEQWNDEADSRLKKEGIQPVIDKLIKKERLTGAEQVMVEKYKATLDAEVRKNPSDENLSKAKELLQLLDVAGTEWGIEGRARQLRQNPLSDITDFYVSAMEAKGVDSLTDAEKAEVQKDYAEVQAAREKAEQVAKEATAKFEEMKAENELLKQQLAAKNKSKSDKVYTKDGKRDFKAEINNYKDELKKAVEDFKTEGQKMGLASDGGLKSTIITAKMAKIILKIAAVHVEQVGVKIAEVAQRTWEDVKDIFDGITDKDIRDVFSGMYNEKKLTKNEIVAQMRELKSESILLNEYERLLNNGEPKEEGKKQKRNQRLADIRKKIDALNKERGTGKYSDEAIAKRAIDANNRKNEEFKRKLREGEFEKEKEPVSIYDSPQFKKKNPELYKKLLDSQNQAHDSQLKFEKKLVEEEMKKWGLGEKARSWFKKFSGTIKTMFASFDASAIAIQNYPMILGNPRMGIKGIARSYKGFLKQKAFDRFLADIHNSSDWPMIKESIRITEPKSLLESGREDFFPDRFKAVVTIKGKQYGWIKLGNGKYELFDISKPFERQFTMLGNILRITKFRIEAGKLYEKGLTWEKNPEEFKTLGIRLNNLTSSPDIPQAYQSEITRTFIWSSRLIAAKLNMLGISDIAAMIPGLGVKKGYYKSLGVKGQTLSRQQWAAIQDLAKFSVGVMTMTVLYALAVGGKINDDPDDNGFLDVEYEAKDGSKKSMNFTAGNSRLISLIFQVASGGKRKDGQFKKYGGWTDPVKEVGRYVAGKAPPLTRTSLNIAAGKDMGGQDADISTEAAKYKMPLAVGQIYKQIDRDGFGALVKEGFLMYIGINAKDSRDWPKSQSNTITIKDPRLQKDYERTKDDEEKKDWFTAKDIVARVEHKGEVIEMTEKEKTKFKEDVEKERSVVIDKYFEDYGKYYDGMSDEQRKEKIGKLQTKARENVVKAFIESHKSEVDKIEEKIRKQKEQSRKEVEERN